MKRCLVVVLALAGAAFSLNAQNIDRIFAKDGSLYEGYISMQEPGKLIEVSAQCATLVVENAAISDVKYQTKELASLPENMQAWLKQNRPGDKKVKVASLKVRSVQYSDVLVLEKGSKYKLVIIAPSKYEIKWGDIVKSIKIENASGEKSPVAEVVTLKDGKQLKGNITEQIIGTELKIKAENSNVESVLFSDVLSIQSELTDKASDIWTALPLLDKVELKDDSVLVGFISARMMGKSIVFKAKGSTADRTIALTEIAKYHKVVNSYYVAPKAAVVEEKPKQSAAPADKPAPVENVTPSTPAVENAPAETKAPTSESTDRKPRTSRWDEAEAAEKAAQEAAAKIAAQGIKINDKIATLNLVQATAGVNYLIHDVVDVVAVGRNVRINLPTSLHHSNMKIVKLRKYNIPGAESKQLWGWTTEDEEDRVVPAYSIDSENSIDGRWNIEIKAENLTPGVYVLLPLMHTCRCVSFRVKK